MQVDFDAVKKDEFTLLATALTELAKKTGHPELEHLPLCFTGAPDLSLPCQKAKPSADSPTVTDLSNRAGERPHSGRLFFGLENWSPDG